MGIVLLLFHKVPGTKKNWSHTVMGGGARWTSLAHGLLVFHPWMGPKGSYTSKVSTAALLSYYQNILTVLALSFILFRFLALYRPGLWDWGSVNGTQTGISNIHSNLLLQNLRKIDISSSLSCNPPTGLLDSAFSPTW